MAAVALTVSHFVAVCVSDKQFSLLHSEQRQQTNNQKQATDNAPIIEEVISHGVIAKPFEPWTGPFPCFPPDQSLVSANFQESTSMEPPKVGLVFMKPMKVGGSTAASWNLRMAKNTAIRTNATFPFCRHRSTTHTYGFKIQPSLDDSKSFKWTVLRDPTQRAVSQYFHFELSRKNTNMTTDASFQAYLKKEKWIINYYLRFLSSERVTVFDADAPALINQTLASYNFIAITERMEESAVALMMLLNAPMRDFLYLSVKQSGGYDDGSYGNQCTLLQPSFVSDGMRKYFQSKKWKNRIQWDELLHQAANRSLDLTIDRLGRDAFRNKLSQFQAAQKLVNERCGRQEVFPCTSTGQHNPNASCLIADSACGWQCLDLVADELKL